MFKLTKQRNTCNLKPRTLYSALHFTNIFHSKALRHFRKGIKGKYVVFVVENYSGHVFAAQKEFGWSNIRTKSTTCVFFLYKHTYIYSFFLSSVVSACYAAPTHTSESFTMKSKTVFIEHLETVIFSSKEAENQKLESIRQTHFDPIGSGNIGNVLSTGTAPRFTALMHTQTIETQCHRHQ